MLNSTLSSSLIFFFRLVLPISSAEDLVDIRQGKKQSSDFGTLQLLV